METIHHLDEEETDILKPLCSKLHDKIQLQLTDAGQLASNKSHPELSRKPEQNSTRKYQYWTYRKTSRSFILFFR
ncbi:unnamed protein product [Rotaria sp. Silwood2]|nr:unnamed protein product [Rotaria sp. Silwood2]